MALPVSRTGRSLVIAMANPSNIFAIDDMKFITGYEIEARVASEATIKKGIDRAYDSAGSMADVMKGMEDELSVVEEDDAAEAEAGLAGAEEAPIVKLVNSLIADAVRKGASDIHIEPYERSMRVRFRIDGVLQAVMANPYGMVLVTGPTGSGKTTTLYSALSRINTPEVNVMTAEDPVEYNLDGINQVLVHEDVGLTFSAALKAFLRQDPNIIMVGEIRDLDTASIAVKAALTGHLVLSTLPTNDAPSAIGRMVDMGIEPFLVASSINLVLAQRLVRRVCNACKRPIELNDEVLRELQLDKAEAKKATFVEGAGCVECNNSGYRGRQGVYEVLTITPQVRDLVLDRASAGEIKKLAVEQGMLTLRRDALEKLKRGITTVEEVLKETSADKL